MAMEDSGMMSPADIAALTRGNTGFGGDGISWLVLILLFFGFMGGGWGGRYGNGELGQYATASVWQTTLLLFALPLALATLNPFAVTTLFQSTQL